MGLAAADNFGAAAGAPSGAASASASESAKSAVATPDFRSDEKTMFFMTLPGRGFFHSID